MLEPLELECCPLLFYFVLLDLFLRVRLVFMHVEVSHKLQVPWDTSLSLFMLEFPACLGVRTESGAAELCNCRMALELLIHGITSDTARCLGEEYETLCRVLCSDGLWKLLLFPFLQRKQEQKAPDKDAILKATANLPTRSVDRTVTHHNMRDVSTASFFTHTPISKQAFLYLYINFCLKCGSLFSVREIQVSVMCIK